MGKNVVRIVLQRRFSGDPKVVAKADKEFEAWGDRVFGHPDNGRKSAITVLDLEERGGALCGLIKCPSCGDKVWVNAKGGTICKCGENLG